MKNTIRVALFLSLILSTAHADWTQFRGPNGLGQAPDADLPINGSKETAKWRTPLEGKAWSSPVILDGQIWVTNAPESGKKLYAVCLDFKTGKVLKNILVFDIPKPQKAIWKNSYATPTPVLEKGRVYISFGVHGTACLDTKTGEKIWARQDIQCNHWRGPGSSPIIHKDHLFLCFDGYDKQFVIALNKNTGKTVWRRDRNDDFDYRTTNGDLKKAFGTPALLTIGEKKHLVCPAAVATVAYDPETGKTLWTVRTEGMNAAGIPQFRKGLVYLTNGMGRLLAVKPDPSKGKHEATIKWVNRRGMPKAPSLLLLGDRIFGVSEKGVASWMYAESGRIVWQDRIGGGCSASPLYAKGRIYCFDEKGKVVVYAAQDEMKKLASFDMGEGFMASPAVEGNVMILRTKKAIYRIER